ncbi:MAG: hypothetical protein ABSA72_10960 [Nitrososphaerales archaeon]|jgi:hypothetical protein
MRKSPFLSLVRAGRIPVGTELFHRGIRTNDYDSAEALVVEAGIQVKGLERIYTSPSTAATAVTRKNEDGWLFWRVRPSGELLDTLRDHPLRGSS